MPVDKKEAANRKALFAKVKGKLAKNFDTAKTKAPVKRGQQLPGGIINGHAVLSSWNIAKTEEKGIPFFSITGICRVPEEYDGARVTVTHFLQESQWATWEDITNNLVSDLKLLGADRLENHPLDDDFELDDLPDMLDELCEAKPEFLFNTRKAGKRAKNPDAVYISIQGLVEDEEADEDTDANEEVEEDEDEETPTDTDGDEDEDEAADDDDGDEEAADEDEDDEEGDEDAVIVPEVGDACQYKTAPKKTEWVEVVKVYKKTGTADIKVRSTKKVLKGVAFDKLIWPDSDEE